MNLVDAYVTSVLQEPYERYGKWWVVVEADSWGHIDETTLMFDTKEEADRVSIGYQFLS